MDVNLLESGFLELWIGPMFSGKSSSLIKELYKMADTGYSVCLIRNVIDQREKLVHSGLETEGKIVELRSSKLSEINIESFDVIGIDEVQFFSEIEKIVDWVDNGKKLVFCAGLDGDFLRRPFGRVLELIPFADRVVKLSAKCHHCTEKHRGSRGKFRLVVDSPFTARISGEDDQVVVGAEDKYVSLCRHHYLEQCKEKRE